jgi:hypothetical protein
MRGGDHESPELLLERYEAFFDCAQQITDTRGAGYSKVVWFLVTDSAALKRAAAKQLGRRLLTDMSYKPGHISDGSARCVCAV